MKMEMEMEMEMMMDHRDVKRKREVEKKIMIVINSWHGKKCVGIFEFNIQLTCSSNDELVVDYLDKKKPLEPICMLYNQRKIRVDGRWLIWSVGSCLVGSKLYLFPDDSGDEPKPGKFPDLHDNKHTRNPCTFDLITRTEQDLPVLPQSRKLGPIVTVVRNQLFALSAFALDSGMIPHPCFESLNLDDDELLGEWRDLNCSPLHQVQHFRYRVSGYALLGQDFLLVSLSWGWESHLFYSYNFRTATWKETDPPPYPTKALGCPNSMYNHALVVGTDIYTFHPTSLELLVFSYTDLHNDGDQKKPDISLGQLSRVEGLVFQEKFDIPFGSFFLRSTTISKVEDGLFCLLHSLCPPWDAKHEQGVHVSFIQIKARELCIVIKSLTCTLSVGTELCGLVLESCYVLPGDDEEKQDQHRRKIAANDTDDQAAALKMGMDCAGARG